VNAVIEYSLTAHFSHYRPFRRRVILGSDLVLVLTWTIMECYQLLYWFQVPFTGIHTVTKPCGHVGVHKLWI